MIDAIAKGERLSDVLFGLALNQKASPVMNFDLFNGALACLLDSWSSMVIAGVTVTTEDKRVENFLNGSRARMLCDLSQTEVSDRGLYTSLMAGLCYVVDFTRENIRFVIAKPSPVVEKPLNVNIISQPTAVSVQEVVRDEKMEILKTVSTTQYLNATA
jgi:hypothetical protein